MLNISAMAALISGIILGLILMQTHTSLAATRLHLSVPVPEIKTGGMLSLYCQVWDLSSRQLVTISRHGGGKIDDGDEDVITSRLTWGDYVERGVDDRTFLAVRTQRDGSVVHFVTIIDVRREEEGEYRCSIRDSNTLGEIVGDDVPVKVHHLPPEHNPICSSVSASEPVKPGDVLTLSCASEMAYPSVNLVWTRTGDYDDDISGMTSSPEVMTAGGVHTLVLNLTVSAQDNGAVFVCTASSVSFSEYSKACHIGPLKVKHIPSIGEEGTNDIINRHKPSSDIADETYYDKDNTIRQILPDAAATIECNEYCTTTLSTPTFYWIIATVIAGIFAALLFFVGVVLVVKYRRTPKYDVEPVYMQTYGSSSGRTEDIYTELDLGSPPDGVRKIYYMSLAKRVEEDAESLPCRVGNGSVIGGGGGDVYTMTTFQPDSNF